MKTEVFWDRMKSILGQDYPAFADAVTDCEAVRAFRVHLPAEKIGDFLSVFPYPVERHPVFSDAFYCTAEKLGNTPFHHAGLIYLQDPSAMAVVHALDIQKGWHVLDLCAAPGGKTTQLSAAVGKTGAVVACEYVEKRCAILNENLERLGCSNTVVLHTAADAVAGAFPGKFDLVLCDAPCSGEGMFRKNSRAQDEWSPENVTMCAERQKRILESAVACVRPGGYLLYSTCTFAPEENEENAAYVLSRFPEMELCAPSAEVTALSSPGLKLQTTDMDPSLCRRFYPHVHRGEGQFLALFRKAASAICGEAAGNGKGDLKTVPEKDMQTVRAFLEQTLDGDAAGDCLLKIFKNRIYLVRPQLEQYLTAPGLVTPGVPLGDLEKGRLEPHHWFAKAFGHEFRNRIDLTGREDIVRQYLTGTEIPVEEGVSGFCALTYAGGVLGCVKASSGRGKNRYPKGLRLAPGTATGPEETKRS
ncbi:MAG: NOL1/NOP2/sun family putative RNA methylase [Clostridia bacterium]|nr:NOL1/NOP2/sun family putative RNA methylase [Clostridia bacterium]